MTEIKNKRLLLEAVNTMIHYLNEDEVQRISLVLYEATLRLEKEGNVRET